LAPARRRLESEVTMHTVRLSIAALILAWSGTAFAADAPPGASSCSGCHPAARFVATPVPRLMGRNADEIVAAMAEFRTGKRTTTVMDRIAKGFTDDETKAIAAWFAAQKD
jgi:sulfide dehydrogenase cytochrome subunit